MRRFSIQVLLTASILASVVVTLAANGCASKYENFDDSLGAPVASTKQSSTKQTSAAKPIAPPVAATSAPKPVAPPVAVTPGPAPVPPLGVKPAAPATPPPVTVTPVPAPAPTPVAPPVAVTPAPAPVAPPVAVTPGPAPVPPLGTTVTPVPAPIVLKSEPIDPTLPDYKPQIKVEGTMHSVGSDSMDPLMQKWEAKFREFHPGLEATHDGKGSGTAVSALLDNSADIAPMSRPVNDQEARQFYSEKTYSIVQVKVAVDSLAINVHPSNPILKTGLDLQQLDAIFSSTQRRGGQDVLTWGQLGLTGIWADKPIVVYSQAHKFETSAFFRDQILKGGHYRDTNHELDNNPAVVDAVSKDPFAIGYSGIGYKTDAVSTVKIAAQPGDNFYPPTARFAYNGQYPLTRYLYVVVDQKPNSELTPIAREFLRFVYSKEGQQIAADQGYFPLPAAMARQEMIKVGLNPGF